MKEIDFHGFTLEDAIKILEEKINHHYAKNELVQYRLITGHGIIQKKFMELLKEYDCKGDIEMGNTGVILAEIGIEL